MQFITTDQRIAVENFEVGLIYTVTFSNGDSFTGACIGIGPDFVAFQRTAPKLLFCLTMAAAADVASIEPLPADIGQIIEYTGSVPVSIKTNGSPLLDYLITGNTIQNGTPTPDNPIMPQGTGDLETVGAKAGQYKIPISSANTTTPVYLGEVESMRRIEKLVLTGEVNFGKNYEDPNSTLYYLNFANYHFPFAGSAVALCTHLTPSATLPSSNAGIRVSNSGATMYINFGADVMAAQSSGNTVAGLKEYLAAQYAAGTPVTVWYVLAEPETGIVNEPLMKIGEYADTLSYRQSGVNIPTTDGLDIFDINTTVKPSEVYLKYFSPLF